MNIFCRHSVFISLAGFVGRFLFGLRMFMDIQKCVYFEPLQLHSTMLTLFICDFVCQAKFIVTPFSIRMKLIWTLLRIASIVCYDAANSIAHNNTKNVFIHRNQRSICLNVYGTEAQIHPYSMQVRNHGRHSHRYEHSENVENVRWMAFYAVCTHAHNDFRFIFHLVRSSYATRCGIKTGTSSHRKKHTRSVQPLTRLRLVWARKRKKPSRSIDSCTLPQ